MIADVGVDRFEFDSDGLVSGYMAGTALERVSSSILAFTRELFASYGSNRLYRDLDKQDFARSMYERAARLQTFAIDRQKSARDDLLTQLSESIRHGFSVGVESTERDLRNQRRQPPRATYALEDSNQGKTILSTAADKLVRAQAQTVTSAVNAFLSAAIAVSTGRVANPSATLYQAIDDAFVPQIAKGYVGKVASDGRGLEISNYGEMLVRESSHQALLQGESAVAARNECYLVHISAHASCCPLCQPYQDTVLVDDYFADGKKDGLHELLSVAIANGLFHWNCRHKKRVVTDGYIPSNSPDYDRDKVAQNYAIEQEQRRLERRVRECKNRALGSLDVGKRAIAQEQAREYQTALNQLVREARNNGYQIYRQNWKEQADYETELTDPYNVNTSPQEPRAVDPITEYGVSPKVHTKAYADTMAQAVGSSSKSVEITNAARKILDHRKDTVYEDMYLFDARTGREVAAVTDSTGMQRVIPNQKVIEALEDSNKRYVLLHNHPGSSIPSITDLNSLYKNKNIEYGLIACHNGDIIKYTKPKQLITEQAWEDARETALVDMSNYEERLIRTLQTQFGFEYRRWKP